MLGLTIVLLVGCGVASLAPVAPVAPSPSPLSWQPVTDFDRFELLTGCALVELVVEGFPEAAVEIGLTEESIETAVERRLRVAGIYSDGDPDNYLYINVNVVSDLYAYSVNVEFKKVVTDSSYSALHGFATTWDIGSTGVTAYGNAGYIRDGVLELVDIFIEDYFRVNADYCSA